MHDKYVALTPVTTADSDGHYAEAIKAALDNENVTNIALTGPYGSGKSSIINSFEKRFSCQTAKKDIQKTYSFLNISLASFSESEESHSDILIERSILQQMIYGISSEKIPLSRFKTVNKDVHEDVKTYFFVAWLFTVIVTVSLIFSGFFSECFLLNSFISWVAVTFSISGLILQSFDIVRQFNRQSIKKINIKNCEIELGEQTENSILNRHLDEILYFFQCNDFDIIIFEDLDRFGSTEIFVKLREINTLINKSLDVNRRVVFLYAIKDEVFSNKERAKFFDFIIPVIPTINSSNSYEKLKNRLPEDLYLNDLTKRNLELDFLKEVSIYIDDMRLLNNIVNEMNLYNSVLSSPHLHPTKLLALIIYKNIYPADFSNLHENKGLVYDCCLSRTDLITFNTRSLLDEIDRRNKELREITNHKRNLDELSINNLKSIYLYQVLKSINNNFSQIQITTNGKQIAINSEELLEDENFNGLFTEDTFTCNYILNNRWASFSISFTDIEKGIDSKLTYLNRRALILDENTPEQKKIKEQISALVSEKEAINKYTLHELLQKRNELPLFSKKEYIDDKSYDLLRYLLRNGHIDEYYHDHLSYFYDGRLAHNDMLFIKAIRDFRVSDYELQLTYYSEIIKNRLRLEDFQKRYVFNISLLDHLIDNSLNYKEKLQLVLQNISTNINDIWPFIFSYKSSSQFVGKFFQLLSKQYSQLGVGIITSNQISKVEKDDLIKLILLHVESDYISESMDIERQISNYLADNPECLLCMPVGEQHAVLPKVTSLNVKFNDLEDINTDEILFSHVYDNSLYEITPENIILLLSELQTEQGKISPDKIEQKNLSVIHEFGHGSINKYIHNNIETYLVDVFLALPANTEETPETILELLENSSISDELKKSIIIKQNHVFQSFESIPTGLWRCLLEESKLEVTWRNLAEFYSKHPEYKVTLIDVLNSKAEELSNMEVNSDGDLKDTTERIIEIVLEDDLINEPSFAMLIKSLQASYTRLSRYSIPRKKMKSLLDENILSLTLDNYEGLTEEHNELVGQLILNNLANYWSQSDKYPLTTETSLYLLDAIESLINQVALIKLLNEEDIKSDSRLIGRIADILSKVTSLEKFEDSLLYIIIENATNTLAVMPIFIKVIDIFDKGEITALLKSMGSPYSAIASYSSNPRLENNSLNKSLAIALKEVDYVSSQKIRNDKIEIYTKNS
jgi:hypothetical protein